MAYLLAVGAALANALTTILQRLGVREAPADASLRLRLLVHAVRHPVWIAGFVMMIAGFGFQAAALHYGPLSSVQPVLTLELPFLVAILGLWFRLPIDWREWAGALLGAGGLAVFLVAASPQPGSRVPGLVAWGMVAFSVLAACAVAVGLAQFGSPQWRAAMFGAAAAVMFAFTASLIREVMLQASQRWDSIFGHWALYAMAAAGLTGVFLAQNAFHAGPVTASQSTLVILDPLASLGIGIGLFGDQLQTGGGRAAIEPVALILLCIGALILARSPVVADLRKADEPAGAERSGVGEALRRARDASPRGPAPAPGGLGTDKPAWVPARSGQREPGGRG